MSKTNKKFCPTPVSIVRSILPGPTRIWSRLVVSIIIDIVGVVSHIGLDWVWAPIQTILIMALYETTIPSAKYVSFVEEILPFTDIVPTATIAWFIQHGRYLFRKKTTKHDSQHEEKKDDNNNMKKQQQQQQKETEKQQRPQQKQRIQNYIRILSCFVIVVVSFLLYPYREPILNYLLVKEKELHTYIMNFNFTI
jgi:hypothetical protein